MIERRISIGNIDPIDFYGINNAKFITLKEFFPKLKITARGDEIIIQGEESDIDVLVAKINALLEHYNKYNMLTIANLKRIILEDEIVEDPEDPASIIVFGNNGKLYELERQINVNSLIWPKQTTCFLPRVRPAPVKPTRQSLLR